ncbi:hypothetical protein A9498_08795 [Bacillus thuringiensis serovar coreanensis]|nr:hypothetical protein A9498_08795 [Bacillus thuringiensis serovar coreanensis]
MQEKLIERCIFLSNEIRLIGNKTRETHLGFAILLKFYQYQTRFPPPKKETPEAIINYIAKQLKLNLEIFEQYKWSRRTLSLFSNTRFFGFHEGTEKERLKCLKNRGTYY